MAIRRKAMEEEALFWSRNLRRWDGYHQEPDLNLILLLILLKLLLLRLFCNDVVLYHLALTFKFLFNVPNNHVREVGNKCIVIINYYFKEEKNQATECSSYYVAKSAFNLWLSGNYFIAFLLYVRFLRLGKSPISHESSQDSPLRANPRKRKARDKFQTENFLSQIVPL